MDATKPTDVEIAGAIPAYIREVRAAVNALSGAGNVGVTDLTIAAGAVALTIGTELGLYSIDLVVVDAVAGVNIATILGGTEGQVKVFVFQDNNIGIVDGLASNGHIYLNQLPVLSTFAAQQNDVLALVNIGGDGSSVQGYWKELFRQIALK